MSTDLGPEVVRAEPRILSPADASKTFDEAVATLEEEDAIREARRALAGGFDLAASSAACPFHVDIPRFVQRLAEGDIQGAHVAIRQSHPFPSIFGRMCHLFCERALSRQHGRQTPAIRDLERFVGDYGDPSLSPFPMERPPSGKRVAVIGGGSAGLGATWTLRRLGHDVDVYDRLPVPGGMLVAGYPPFRMSKFTVRRDNDPNAWGARYFAGYDVSRQSFEALVAAYDLTLIAFGLREPRVVGIPGEDATGVWNAIDFINAASLGNAPQDIRCVLVLGAGDTARDAARTAVRLGADTTICYRRTRDVLDLGGGVMAKQGHIQNAADEGVKLHFLAQPVRIVVDDRNCVTGVEFVRTEMSAPDETGKPSVVLVPGSEYVIPCDTVIEAVGEAANLDILPKWIEVRDGLVVIDPAEHRTSHPRVFAAGDIAGDHGNELGALSAMQAARTMDSVLRGEPIVRFEPTHLRREPAQAV